MSTSHESKRPAVFLISGRAHSGKDTAGDIIASLIKQNSGKTVTTVALADRLKLVVQRLVAIFYGKTIPIKDFYNSDKKEKVHRDLPLFHGKLFTIRRGLQIIGSEVFRDLLWKDVWCNVIGAKIAEGSAQDVFIITDCRFPSEAQYFKNLLSKKAVSKLICIKMVRPSTEKDLNCTDASSHSSELSVDSINADLEILNDGTIQELRDRLEFIVGDCEDACEDACKDAHSK